MAIPRQDGLTPTEYLALDRQSDVKYEYIDGLAYAMSGAGEEHINITGNLFLAVQTRLRQTPCHAYAPGIRVWVEADNSYFYPDLTAVCGKREFLPETSAATLANPAFVAEVLSPSTDLFDRTTKFAHYRAVPTLRDYMLIAQARPLVEIFSRTAENSWTLREAVGLNALIKIPGLNLNVPLAEIYEGVQFLPDKTPPNLPVA